MHHMQMLGNLSLVLYIYFCFYFRNMVSVSVRKILKEGTVNAARSYIITDLGHSVKHVNVGLVF